MLTGASSPLLSLSASQPLAPRSLNCSQSPPSLSSTLTALFRNNMPDEATTSLRTHLSGPCLCNDQPLTVYVAASPLLSHSRFSLSLPFAPLLSASQPPLSRAGCLALLVSLCLSGSACLALLVSLCLSRSASSLCLSRTLPRSICLALPLALSVSHWLSRSGCLALPVLHCLPALSVPRCLSGSCCPALSVPRCLSGYACLALSVWLCLSRSACFALPVSLCLSGSACLALPIWLCLSGSAAH